MTSWGSGNPVYEVLLERRVERELERLPAGAFGRVIQHLQRLAENPRPHGCRKLVGSQSDWRIRVGEYRVVYEIDDEAEVVRVMRVRRRKDIYR